MNTRALLAISTAMFMAGSVCGQSPQMTGREWSDPSAGSVGRAPLRNEFISYDTREAAEKDDREATEYYVPLPLERTVCGNEELYSVAVDIPFMWVDRDLFLHVEGFPGFYVDINGKAAGYSQDSKCPSEFFISPKVTDGLNTIVIRVPEGGAGRRMEDALAQTGEPYVFLYSQPKVRIEDYKVVTAADSSGRHRVFDLEVAVSNSYNGPETFMIGFDVYSPEGKLQTYDIREVRVPGHGRDTVRFRELIYHAMQNLWSTDKPKLYSGMVYVKRAGRLIEYVPFKAGFGEAGHDGSSFTRNGAAIELDAVRYNAAPTEKKTLEDLNGLKLRGVNTVAVDYPQRYWFYDLCDRVGMNVIDQANVNFSGDREDLRVGGTLSNNPLWERAFTERMAAAYARSRAHACIIGWSTGGDVGNGYNMYKSYQYLKGTGDARAVVFNDAGGQWNADATVKLRDARAVLDTPAPKPAPARGRR